MITHQPPLVLLGDMAGRLEQELLEDTVERLGQVDRVEQLEPVLAEQDMAERVRHVQGLVAFAGDRPAEVGLVLLHRQEVAGHTGEEPP